MRDTPRPRVAAHDAAAAAFREEAGRLTASLVRQLGDFELAEELVQDALVTALERWPFEGIPAKPGAWLLTVARHRATDLARRDARYREKLTELEHLEPDEPDDRLRLIFICCHPALSLEAQVALTLRTVLGLTVDQISALFLTSEATIAQRLVRARRKIAQAAIPYRLPAYEDMDERLQAVLAVLYLLFNQGYVTGPSSGYDLTADAEWLASLLARLLPDEPEVLGLLALMRLHRSRAGARFDPEGNVVLLRNQDRSTWNHAAIAEAGRLLEAAARQRRPGPYQLQAAVAACHAEATTWETIDWPQIVALYDELLRMAPSPVAALNRAIAVAHASGPTQALKDVDALMDGLSGYYLFHATRAELLRQLRQPEEARVCDQEALRLAPPGAERDLIQQRLTVDA
ncbi:MAG: sigma-70 family RNA polymerase sigma factor [Chloroflexi bacterium]|nr:sigma-70 family RNA polymerase sigma factor [Chloroflexota bacterium]